MNSWFLYLSKLAQSDARAAFEAGTASGGNPVDALSSAIKADGPPPQPHWLYKEKQPAHEKGVDWGPATSLTTGDVPDYFQGGSSR